MEAVGVVLAEEARDELAAAGDAHLLEHGLDVVADGVRRQEQLRGDLARRAASRIAPSTSRSRARERVGLDDDRGDLGALGGLDHDGDGAVWARRTGRGPKRGGRPTGRARSRSRSRAGTRSRPSAMARARETSAIRGVGASSTPLLQARAASEVNWASLGAVDEVGPQIAQPAQRFAVGGDRAALVVDHEQSRRRRLAEPRARRADLACARRGRPDRRSRARSRGLPRRRARARCRGRDRRRPTCGGRSGARRAARRRNPADA